jgi:hypothetical protein
LAFLFEFWLGTDEAEMLGAAVAGRLEPAAAADEDEQSCGSSSSLFRGSMSSSSYIGVERI